MAENTAEYVKNDFFPLKAKVSFFYNGTFREGIVKNTTAVNVCLFMGEKARPPYRSFNLAEVEVSDMPTQASNNARFQEG
tara:strand:+ start:327 stop:566 length:240 start_codon:yes stop_codon:yes gene_type:complete